MADPDIGNIIRFHRKRAKLTRIELAVLAGIGKTVVFDIEKGKTSVRCDSVRKILRVLNISTKFESPLMAEFNSYNAQSDSIP